MPAPRPRVLLTGSTGYLGRYLLAELRARGLPVAAPPRRGGDLPLDLADPATVRAALRAVRPDVVLSCGALSRLGDCEADPELARRVNELAPALLAESGARLVQVSTDLVFDGRSPPYTSAAAPCPLSVYGRTKAAAETAAVAAGGLAVRLPLLFGPSFDGRRGATDMIRSAASVTLFTNEHRTPLHVADAARALVDLLLEARRGLVHVAGPERISRFELGRRFAAAVGLPESRLRAAECSDPLRPRDLALVSDLGCGRSLDDALRAS